MPNILIIEDNAEIAQLIRMHMEDLGHRCHWEANGAAGLEQAKAQRFDLIVLDLMLPGLDGLEICRALRAGEKTKNIPVIMITAKSEETDQVVGFSMGAGGGKARAKSAV